MLPSRKIYKILRLGIILTLFLGLAWTAGPAFADNCGTGDGDCLVVEGSPQLMSTFVAAAEPVFVGDFSAAGYRFNLTPELGGALDGLADLLDNQLDAALNSRACTPGVDDAASVNFQCPGGSRTDGQGNPLPQIVDTIFGYDTAGTALHLYTPPMAWQKGIIRDYLTWVTGPRGRSILRSQGFTAPAYEVVWWGEYTGQDGRALAVYTGGLSDILAAASGDDHTLALSEGGDVWAWGNNAKGQLGVGDQTDRVEPVQLAVDAAGGQFGNISAVAAGGRHSLALMQGGGRTYVYAWGENAYGQLGDGTQIDRALPVLVTVPGLEHVKAIAAGVNYSLALTDAGQVIVWGGDQSGQAQLPPGLNDPLNPVVAIAAGAYHALALKSSGVVLAWGEIEFGRTLVPPGLFGVTGIAAGGQHSLALIVDGSLAGWGGEEDPSLLQFPAGLNGVLAVAAGDDHTLALKIDGSVAAWGCGISISHGQCGVPAGLNQARAVSAGRLHSLALRVKPPATPDAPAWDLNGDHVMNLLDIVAFGAVWNTRGEPGWVPADIVRDGVIDVLDIAELGAHWNETW